jgi:hypothetical protein
LLLQVAQGFYCFLCFVVPIATCGEELLAAYQYVHSTQRIQYSNGKIVSTSRFIYTYIQSWTSKIWIWLNVTIRHIMIYSYPNLIQKFDPRDKTICILYPQYPFVSDPFSLLCVSTQGEGFLGEWSYTLEHRSNQNIF